MLEEATPEDIAHYIALRNLEAKEREAAERRARARAQAKRQVGARG